MWKLRLHDERGEYLIDWRWTGPSLPSLVIWNNGSDPVRYFLPDVNKMAQAIAYSDAHPAERVAFDYHEISGIAEIGRLL